MHKIIHTYFEIDLSSTNISLIEDNAWFSNRFFSKYSLPLDIIIKENPYFNYFLEFNRKTSEKLFNVIYVRDQIMEKAVFEISDHNDGVLKAKVRYGLEELPNYNKKLTDLPLEEIAITDMLAHFQSIIPQTYPAVNYNFPQIFTNKYIDDKEMFGGFLGLINNYDGISLPINEIISTPINDPNHDLDGIYNRNFVKPVISFLYLLRVGFQDAGYTLVGDIINDETIKKMWLFCSKNKFVSEFNFKHLINVDDYDTLSFYAPSIPPNSIAANYAIYSDSYPIPPGDYKISGKIKKFTGFEYSSSANVFASTDPIDYNNVINGFSIFRIPKIGDSEMLDEVEELTVDFKIIIPDDGISYYLHITAEFPILTSENFNVFDIEVVQTAFLITYNNDIKLTDNVPNMIFGDYLTIMKNRFNLDIIKNGNTIELNFINNSINTENAISLKDYEVKKVKQKFKKSLSFLLKYASEDDDNSEKLYHDVNGVISENIPQKQNTKTITIDTLPLPIKSDIITTANSTENNDEKIYAVLYNGLQDPFNTGTALNTVITDLTPFKLTTIHDKYYKNWFDFRINSTAFLWSFYLFAEKSRNIDVRKKMFAYGLFHILKNLKRTQITPNLYKITVEAHSLQ